MMRWNHPLSLSLHLECFPSHPLYPSLPSSFPLALLRSLLQHIFCSLAHGPSSSLPLQPYTMLYSNLQVSTQCLHWSQSLWSCIRVFILTSKLSFLSGVASTQNRHAHSFRLLMNLCKYKGEGLFKSPTRREAVGLTRPLCLPTSCRNPPPSFLSDSSCFFPGLQDTRRFCFHLPTFLTPPQGSLQSCKSFRLCLAET